MPFTTRPAGQPVAAVSAKLTLLSVVKPMFWMVKVSIESAFFSMVFGEKDFEIVAGLTTLAKRVETP